MTYNDVTKNEKAISGALALATHLLFLALLVFSVSWQQKRPDSAVIVDLWNNLPPLPQPKVEEPVPEAKPAPEPPKPAPKVEPKPLPKPVIKPDIALKEKLEKARREKEQLEAKKREEDKKKQAVLKAQQDKLDKAKLEKEREEQLRKVLEKDAAQSAAAQSRLLDEYKRRVSERIKRFIVLPPNIQGNPEAQFEVVQIPGGEIFSVKLKRSSGVAAYDGAVERAILKAQPLPPPPDAGRFNEVRELELKFRPKE
jgi:colicin import membrane protein